MNLHGVPRHKKIQHLRLQNRLKKKLMSQLGSNFDLNDEEAIENNLLKMDVYYKQFNFEDITEVPGYSVCICIPDFMYYLFAIQ